MQRRIRGIEVMKINAKRELPNGSRSHLEHVLVNVPRLSLVIKFIEDLERLLGGILHLRSVMANCFRA